jgi:hypothetical protein
MNLEKSLILLFFSLSWLPPALAWWSPGCICSRFWWAIAGLPTR